MTSATLNQDAALDLFALLDREQVSEAEAEARALRAEGRIQPSATMDEREYWQLVANYWWDRA